MSKKDTCEIYCYDEEKVNRIQGELQKEDISSVVLLFKALADENRAKIAYSLCQDEELCVCDIANIIGASVATTSHHLRTLYKQGIVKYRKEGKLAFYSLDDDHIKQLIMIALAHDKEVKVRV
ncbi:MULTISPECIES: ArsR/SmtB family transcription factor [Anoxybacillaceae]|jgi:DNA-binding transcriptional ArsR family regulator|uniref:Cadmium efflux system accessory protein (Cadmium-binding protein) n=10 Tax=Anoxybacillaceae TaxID=3120669 RepID=Q5L2G1_GEOKA|nr:MULTISPECIES: metalloregulator ArsR/SmtB family transcription factor [Bacillaceae]ASS87875.1 transcriptional regulator [Geobacillus lituanicus]MED0654650.1 metalloregulator ArsR/SmtB family transcription factor [Anoxybacillus geothermalis]NNU93065.1 transcriptional regulator [Geobacillus sp. NFOSA3]PDM38758.1 transcriptional regulator [Parageobacillus yumthangensis]TXK90548.1 helix-turn-helix transcriptional regulator [Parageobacillus sp. SY1]